MKKQIQSKKPGNKTGKKSRRIADIFFAILVLVMACLLGWSIISQQRQLERINRMNDEKSTLVREFTELKIDYQRVKAWNADYKDQITKDQNRIDRMIREIRYKTEDIQGYRSRVEAQRKKLKQYLDRIDSLETSSVENQDVYMALKASRDSLEDKIQSTSHLNIYNLDILTENSKGKETQRPGKVDRIWICFTLAENIFVPKGEKTFYLRILRPDERLIYASKEDVFMADDQKLNFTAMVTVDYENEDLRVCIRWTNVDADLTEGLYYVNLYAGGREVGSRSFLLENRFLFF